MKTNIPRLNPNLFIFEKYISQLQLALTSIIRNPQDPVWALKPNIVAVGYCEANVIPCRQRDGYVVMVEIDGEEAWFHWLGDLPIFPLTISI